MENLGRRVLGRRAVRPMLAAGLLVTATVCGVSGSGDVRAADDMAAITPIEPARFADTREGQATVDAKYAGWGPIAAGGVFAITIAGRAGVPDDAAAAMMNVTVVRSDGPGHVTVYPCGTSRPTVSNVNYQADTVVANAVLSKIGDGGQICVYSFAKTDVIVDVNGYVPSGGSPVTINPSRFVDTRLAKGGDNPGRLAAGTVYKFKIGGKLGVPADADAVMINLTLVQPAPVVWTQIYACGSDPELESFLVYRRVPAVIPNALLAKLGPDGDLCVTSARGTDLLIDVYGYVPKGGAPTTFDPTRYVSMNTGDQTVDEKYQTNQRVVGGREYRFQIAGRPGIPADATAVMFKLGVFLPEADGHITIYPCGTRRPNVSSINYVGGESNTAIFENAAFSKLGSDGQICVYSLATADVLISANAFVTAPSE